MSQLNSPFKCGSTVKNFGPDRISGSLVIRIDDATATDKVIITLDKSTPATDNADIYLKAGEVIEIKNRQIQDGSQVNILNISGDPNIYWYIK
jgi:hypothetical protein